MEAHRQGMIGFGRDSLLSYMVYSKLASLLRVVLTYLGDKSNSAKVEPYHDMFPVDAAWQGLVPKREKKNVIDVFAGFGE